MGGCWSLYNLVLLTLWIILVLDSLLNKPQMLNLPVMNLWSEPIWAWIEGIIFSLSLNLNWYTMPDDCKQYDSYTKNCAFKVLWCGEILLVYNCNIGLGHYYTREILAYIMHISKNFLQINNIDGYSVEVGVLSSHVNFVNEFCYSILYLIYDLIQNYFEDKIFLLHK